MRNATCPECQWISVTDGTGRRRLEMRWQLPVAPPARASVPRAA